MLQKPRSIFDEPEAIGMRANKKRAASLNPIQVMAEYMDVMNEIAEQQLALSEWVNDSSNPDLHASDFQSLGGWDGSDVMMSLSASDVKAEQRRTAAAEEFGSRKDELQSLIAKAKALKAQMDSL